MAFEPTEFSEDTDFERLMIERLELHHMKVTDPTATYDRRALAGRGNTSVRIGMVEEGAEPRERLRQSLTPLGFAAAYKELDMLVQHVLRANGHAGAQKLGYGQKKIAVQQPLTDLPAPLDVHRDIWKITATLYGKLLEVRHAITHRRAGLTSAGDLEAYTNSGQLICTVTSDEIRSFVASVHAIGELVIAGSYGRESGIAAWHLNRLRSHHHERLLPNEIDPSADLRLLMMDLEELSDGQLRFDVVAARAVVEVQPQPSIWDLELHAEGRIFIGRWEEIPENASASIDFHPATPPEWLTEVVPAY